MAENLIEIPVKDSLTDDAVRTALEKRKKMFARLDSLNSKRIEISSKKKAHDAENANPDENLDSFLADFSTMRTDISNSLDSLTSNEKNALEAKFSAISKNLSNLQEKLTASMLFLPSYDQRHCQKTIDDLESAISLKRTELLPKKRFAFRSKAKVDERSSLLKDMSRVQAESQLSARSAEIAEKLESISSDLMEISNKSLEVLYFGPNDLSSTDVSITNAQNSTISLCAPLSALKIHDVKNCKLYIGPVSGSCHIERCSNSTFILASRQIRIHEATNCDFYLRVSSDPIIEHSSGVRVAPYIFRYEGLDGHLKDSGLLETPDRWSEVKDFNWLRSQQSPNWSIIPETERLKDVRPMIVDDDEEF
eukprot:238013_1